MSGVGNLPAHAVPQQHMAGIGRRILGGSKAPSHRGRMLDEWCPMTANGGNPRCADGLPPPICSEPSRRPGASSMNFLDQLRGVPVTHVATILKTNKHNRKLSQGSVQLFRNERVKAGVGPSYVLSIKGRSGVPIAISACTRRSSCRAEAEHKAPALLQFGLTTRDYHV